MTEEKGTGYSFEVCLSHMPVLAVARKALRKIVRRSL